MNIFAENVASLDVQRGTRMWDYLVNLGCRQAIVPGPPPAPEVTPEPPAAEVQAGEPGPVLASTGLPF